MSLPGESQLPELSRPSLLRAARPALAPALRLVPAADAARVEFAAVKGAAPGGYVPGPALLVPGARVGILCDTLHGDREIGLDYAEGLRTAAELVRELGFEPVIDHKHAAVAPYFERWAGSPQARVEHVVRLIEEYRVDALFPLFGKGGSHAVVDAIAASDYRPSRKLVLLGGFSHHSDWALFAQSPRGRDFFSHVINATQSAYWRILPRANVDNLKALLSGASRVEYTGLRLLNHAPLRELSGPLSGGNLSALLLNRDKAWMPNLRGRIVVVEDYDRHAHDFHRSFSAFARDAERAGAEALLVCAMLPLKRAAHVQLEPETRQREQAKDREELDAIVREVASCCAIPVFQQAAICGHGAMNYPLGMGAPARIRQSGQDGYTLTNELELRS